MNKKTISVYGSSGFIGSHFVKKYKEDYNLIKIPRNQDSSESNEALYFISTTTNYNVFADAFLDINTNLSKLINVLESNKNKKGFVFNFISSWFVYGDHGLNPCSEETYCDPKGFYSITKRAAEQLLISYCETFNMKYRIIRLCNVIGKGDSFSLKKNALQKMIDNLKNDDPVSLYDGGQHLRDYLHVHDVCSAINLVIKKMPVNEIINVGRGESNTISDMIEYAKGITQSNSEITSVEPPNFHKIVQARDIIIDTRKIQKLGFVPNLNIYESIKLLI
jgi:nucleoside-diphosphate-sugar epimerase|tara:strand:+ start:13252 stop:14085 length:834 start_codon:yes stop_codon:yes gene_type:complete